MATTSTATPQLIVGGPQPDGYVYVGGNHGRVVWGSLATVTASRMDAEASFHESTYVHICVLCLVLFVLYMVGYRMTRGGWCAEVPSFLGFAIYREA